MNPEQEIGYLRAVSSLIGMLQMDFWSYERTGSVLNHGMISLVNFYLSNRNFSYPFAKTAPKPGMVVYTFSPNRICMSSRLI